MSKAPVPGHTKTRLQPWASPEQCAEIHTACLKDLYTNLKNGPFMPYLYYIGDEDKFPAELRTHFIFRPQKGPNLGAKMSNALKECLTKHKTVVLIGADCPLISTDTINLALNALKTKDLVLGPSNDGGYYLIGLNQHLHELFQGIKWGSTQVFQDTLKLAKKLRLNYFLLSEKVDLDTPEDVHYFLGQQAPEGNFTRSVLSKATMSWPDSLKY